MVIRRILLLLYIHLVVAYVCGSYIYGFSEIPFSKTPNKTVVLILLVALFLFAIYAKENKTKGWIDLILQAVQNVFAVASGVPIPPKGVLSVVIAYVLLAVAIGTCVLRTERQRKMGVQGPPPA